MEPAVRRRTGAAFTRRSFMCAVTRIVALAALLALAQPLSSQVEDGWIVVSSFKTNQVPSSDNPFVGDGGLWLVHPRIPGPPVPVTGLGSDLTGAGLAGTLYGHGASCVLRLPDGRLVVGEFGRGVGIDLHVLTLDGASVALGGDTTLFCGTASLFAEAGGFWGKGGGILQLALLPDGRLLMAVWGIVSGPLKDAHVGLADLGSGEITRVDTGPPGLFSEIVNAIAVDASGTTAYLGTVSSPGQIYTLDVPGGGQPAFLGGLPADVVMDLAVDNDGGLLVGCFDSDVFKMDPGSGSLTPLGLPIQVYAALAVERVTGNHLASQHTDVSAVPPVAWISLVETGPTLTPLLIPPPGGIGLLTGMDVNPDPETYGPASPGANEYAWALAPNPGGLPQAGNLGFSLTLESSPAGAPGVLIAGLEPLVPPVPILGGVLLSVNPLSLVFSRPLAGSPTETIPLPIPLDPNLVGKMLFLQSGHLEGGALAASDAIKLTVL
jgi:hypothetical protein